MMHHCSDGLQRDFHDPNQKVRSAMVLALEAAGELLREIAHHGPVSEPDKAGENMNRSREQALELVKKLLAKGADPNQTELDQCTCGSFGAKDSEVTPLAVTVRYVDLQALEILLQSGANVKDCMAPGIEVDGQCSPDVRLLDYAQKLKAGLEAQVVRADKMVQLLTQVAPADDIMEAEPKVVT